MRKAILPFSLFRAYDVKADLIVCLLWITVVLVCFTGLLQRHIPPIRIALALTALVGMYLVLPYGLGGTMDADGRILPAILVCALAWLGQATVRHFAKLMASGQFTPVIDRRYALDQIVEAYRYVETGQKIGNVVIIVDPSR